LPRAARAGFSWSFRSGWCSRSWQCCWAYCREYCFSGYWLCWCENWIACCSWPAMRSKQ